MTSPRPTHKPDAAEQIGRSSWFDLPVSNLSDAMSFYEGLFSWQYRQMEASIENAYVMIEVNGKLIGGLRQVAAVSRSASAPVIYFNVKNLDEKMVRAKELGAILVGSVVELGRDRGRYH